LWFYGKQKQLGRKDIFFFFNSERLATSTRFINLAVAVDDSLARGRYLDSLSASSEKKSESGFSFIIATLGEEVIIPKLQ